MSGLEQLHGTRQGVSDGVAVVMWDDQWEMNPAPAPGLLQQPGAFSWLLVQGEASGEVWVELAMKMCPITQMDLCDEGRKERLSHPPCPELAEQDSPRDVLNSSH